MRFPKQHHIFFIGINFLVNIAVKWRLVEINRTALRKIAVKKMSKAYQTILRGIWDNSLVF